MLSLFLVLVTLKNQSLSLVNGTHLCNNLVLASLATIPGLIYKIHTSQTPICLKTFYVFSAEDTAVRSSPHRGAEWCRIVLLLFYYLGHGRIAAYPGSLQEGFITTHLQQCRGKHTPAGISCTKAFLESNQNHCSRHRGFLAITRKMQTHEGDSGGISKELQLLPCWRTKPDDNTWKLEAQTYTMCLQSYIDFAVISPTYSSPSKSVGISWSISLKRLLTGVKMTDKVL